MDVYQRRRLVAVLCIAAVLVIIIVAIASGGDDDSSPITTPDGATGASGSAPLSKSEFITQADAICAETNAAVANLSTGTAADDPVLLASQQLQYVRSEDDQLKTLSPPQED